MPKYHQPTDEYEAHFDCGGIAQDAELIYLAGKMLDVNGAFPMWNKAQPFGRFRHKSRYETAFFKDVSQTNLPALSLQGRSIDAKPTDLDSDGDVDILVANEQGWNTVLINDGTGQFTDESQQRLPLLKHDNKVIAISNLDTGGDFYDLDRDGDLDILTGNGFGNSYEVYENDGQGTFKKARDRFIPASIRGNGVDMEMADFNGDGVLDLYLCNLEGKDFLIFGKR